MFVERAKKHLRAEAPNHPGLLSQRWKRCATQNQDRPLGWKLGIAPATVIQGLTSAAKAEVDWWTYGTTEVVPFPILSPGATLLGLKPGLV